MKIYMVEAIWYDDVYEESCHENVCAFTSKESAQKYVDEFPEVNEAAGRRLDELLDKRGYKSGQVIDSDDKELMDAFNEHMCFGHASYDEVDFWITEYELKD